MRPPACARTLPWMGIAAVLCAGPVPARAQQVLVSGVEFVPGSLVSSEPNRSVLAVRGPHLVFNDGSMDPIKRTSPTGGLVVPLAQTLGVPLSVVVRGGFVYTSSGCVVSRKGPGAVRAEVLAQTTQCHSLGLIAVDDASVYFVTFVASPNTWTIRKVSFGGGAAVPLVSTTKEVRGLATDGTNVYWLEEQYPEAPPVSALRRVPVGGGAPLDLATGLRGFRGGLVLQGSDLFFSDTNFTEYRMLRASVSGGGATTLVTVPSGGPVTDIAVDATRVYWTAAGAVRAVPIGGGAAETVVSGLDSPAGLAVAGGQVFWTETLCCAIARNGLVRKAPAAGGPAVTLADQRDWPGEIAADGTHLYWVEGSTYGQIAGYGRVLRLPFAGGLPQAILDSGAGVLPPFAIDDSFVYFANRATLKRVPIGLGPVEELARGANPIQEIVTDGTYVYWTEWLGGPLFRVPVAGGPVEVFGAAIGVFGPSDAPSLDATSVYWIDHNDRILKAPRAGGGSTILASIPFSEELVTDGDQIYVVNQDGGVIERLSVNGGPRSFVTLTESFSQVSLSLDASQLFWIGQDVLCRVPKTGGDCTLVAENLQSTTFVPNAIAADGRGGVYWTETLGGTLKASFAAPTPTAVSLAAVSLQAAEGAGPAVARVHLTTANGAPLAAPVSVQYATVDGTAVAGQHYIATSGTLSISAGTASGVLLALPVPLIDDATDEEDRTFQVVLSNVSGAQLLAPTVTTVVIRDDDAPPLASMADVSVPEGSCVATTAVLAVSLSAASAKTVRVEYFTQDGTAQSLEDYGPTAGVVTFPPGQTAAQVVIPIRSDLTDESDESFLVSLRATPTALVQDAEAAVTIVDDDTGAAPFAAELIHGAALVEDLAAAGPAPASGLYQIAQQPYRSYEIALDGVSGDLVGPQDVGLDRLACGTGAVMQSSAAIGSGPARSLRWQNDAPFVVTEELVRVVSGGCTTDCGDDDVYRIRAWDTTGSIARFNNSASQVTLLILQNASGQPVSGNAHFWDAAGGHLASHGFALPAHGSVVIHTASLLPGLSGSITVSHLGRYGELVGKAVALEPATGYSFDTPLVTRPR